MKPVSPPLIRQVKGLKDVREWSIMTTHSLNGSLEVQETFFLRSRKKYSKLQSYYIVLDISKLR